MEYGRIELMMSLLGISKMPLYEDLEYLQFKLTSDSAKNLNKLEVYFHYELKEALKDEINN